MSAVAKLERALFVQSRDREYFDRSELVTMTGQPVERFPDVIVKELIDNGLDAAEEVGVTPKIVLQVWRRRQDLILSIIDNGGGMTHEAVESILDFRTRTSNKAAYRSPTRGLQGNALKTVIGIPYALGSRQPLVIQAKGKKHVTRAHIDPGGEARIRHDVRDVIERDGTCWKLALPLNACKGLGLRHWLRGYALFNPHAFIKYRDVSLVSKHANSPSARTAKLYKSTVQFPAEWKKFLPEDLIPINWYDEPALAKLIFNHIAKARQGGPDLTLREFVCQFPGFSSTLSTSRSSKVCGKLPDVKHLSDFEGRQELIAMLLAAMHEEAATRPPKPHILGLIGEEHFRTRFQDWFAVKRDGDGKPRFWYGKACLEANGIPYVFEVAVAQTERPGQFFHGVNFSLTFADPFAGKQLGQEEVTGYGVAGYLSNAYALEDHHRYYSSSPLPFHSAAAVHLVCPALQFLDKGKARLDVPEELADAAGKALWDATRILYREGEKRKKDAARQQRAEEKRAKIKDDLDIPLTEVMAKAMPESLEHATGGKYRVSAHTLFYTARKVFQKYTSRTLESQYFEQTLLPPYLHAHPEIQKWIYREARGVLYEPHTGIEVPLGTREVEGYRFPSWRYRSILFVEKQGLYPILKEAKLGERYDMAIIAGEGYATEACRVLFANAEKGDYQIFVAHDADPDGYNIERICREKTKRMPGYNVDVFNVGLTVQDALALGLSPEWAVRKKALPSGLKLTELEQEYFLGEQIGKKTWRYKRFELNSFTAPGLVDYLERGLQAPDGRKWKGKVSPPPEKLDELTRKIYEGIIREMVQSEIDQMVSIENIYQSVANSCHQWMPFQDAQSWIKEAFAADSTVAWDKAVRQKLGSLLGDQSTELQAAVREQVKQIMDEN